MASCTNTDPSYIYWDSGVTPMITFHEYVSNQWLFSDKNNAFDLTLTGSPTTNQQFFFKQIENTDYAEYLRYGDMVYLVQNLCTDSPCTQTSPYYATASTDLVYKMETSPNCQGTGYPKYDYVILKSQTATDKTGVRFDDPVAVKGYPCSLCNGSPNYWGDANPGSPIAWACSPVYGYAIHDKNKSTPKQLHYQCWGTDCLYAPSPSGPSCSSCLSACGQSGSALPANSSTYEPFPGVASLPLAGCAGATACHTYTLYSGQVKSLALLFILGETTASVSTTVPGKVKDPTYPSSNGFLLFSLDGSHGSATVEAPGTKGPTVPWGKNNKWQSWGTGGSAKTINVEISMDGLSFTLNGKTQTVSFVDTGYASGLYCNLYAAQGNTDNNPQLGVAGTTSAVVLSKPTTPSLAPDWWWYGLVITGVITIVMILLVTFCCRAQ